MELPDVAAYARMQICNRDSNKVRTTWGYLLIVYMQEAAWFYPVLSHLKECEQSFIAYGVETGKGGMKYIPHPSGFQSSFRTVSEALLTSD